MRVIHRCISVSESPMADVLVFGHVTEESTNVNL